MLAVLQGPPGAPGVYRLPDTPVAALTGERMDVCGFAGVAPRGPVRVPVFDERWRDGIPCVEPDRPRRRTVAVAVESFDAYRRLFGGFEGPGLLPYAVAAFFEQGGRRAYVARIVHHYDSAEDGAGVSSGVLDGVAPAAKLVARNEGKWGDRLRTAIGFRARSLDFLAAATGWLTLGPDSEVTAGTLLRLTLPGGTRVLRFVGQVFEQPDPLQPRTHRRAFLESSVPAVPDAAETVEATLEVDDGDGRRERHERLGLHRAHPRWLATVLCYESQLLWPDASWAEGSLLPQSVELIVPPAQSQQFHGGADRYAHIEHADFFHERDWMPQDEEPGNGVQAFARLLDLASLAVPDLYSPQPLPLGESILDPVSVAGPTFERCVDLPPPAMQQETSSGDLPNLQLDPQLPEDLGQIIALQSQVVDFAERVRNFVVLLDVPPGLSHRRVLEWRSRFASSYAAAYHPWLQAARRDDSRDRLIRVPPSAIAAGIIARLEIAFGVPHGPANALAREIVNVDEPVSPVRHDELHPLGVNVYLRERDGVRLTGARTLSRDASWRQLSVRRLMIMLRRLLERQMQWAVFEPNGPRLRARLTQLLTLYLRGLFRAGAFRGAAEEEAFFVQCDDALNPPQVMDAGRLIAEIGVAPAEPLEFILLRLSRDGDGTLTVEE
jgi:hypothetical protein